MYSLNFIAKSRRFTVINRIKLNDTVIVGSWSASTNQGKARPSSNYWHKGYNLSGSIQEILSKDYNMVNSY